MPVKAYLLPNCSFAVGFFASQILKLPELQVANAKREGICRLVVVEKMRWWQS